eukprot:TRINITY_DN14559_c0_g1_i2.p1 TRINITY_DN14559_c0_g1~~TRINITY_DN14559_c0_g1_i2.p1  ORF type:complete len:106 (-),score=29.32 TRINITY_DN14559_c0_g1_i2:134-451(-)
MEVPTLKPRKASYIAMIQKENTMADNDNSLIILIGTIIIILAYVLCIFFLYWIAISKMLPHTGHPFLDWLKNDTFYCILVPVLLGPVLVILIYFNWLAIKYFRHT